jgi:hypothetical protein
MGEFHPNPNLNNRIFLAKQQNRAPFISDTMYGDDLLKTQGNNFRTNIVIGKRDGIPQDQPIDYFLQRHFQGNPYVRGMHPYTSNMLVDVVPSVYNTNPLAGRGGYEKNLASFNGTRPLATALDEPQEIAQRLYEDEFKLSANNPLSMQYTINHAGVQKRARGEMYDAFRLGIEKNNEDKEPDYDIVLQSKREKGYNAQGYLPKGDNEKSITTYFDNQEPLRTGIFKERMDQLKTHLTPGPQAAVLPAAAPGAVAAVASGAPNFIGPGSGSNMVQVNQATGTNLFGAPPMTPITPGSPSFAAMSPLTAASMQLPPLYTSSHPLQQASLPGSPAQSLISNATLPTTPAGKSTNLTDRQKAMLAANAAAAYQEQQRQERLRLVEE